jgi:DNA-binding NarL/FixJ family response regulator
MRILIADDHEGVRTEIRCVLEAEHWQVCGEATNGEEVLEKVRQLAPDLVILDMGMPVMNGYDAAREIRRISPPTKILILSMHDPANLPSILAETDADAFVTKSRAVRDLISTIKHL